eukprot:1374106-Amphidinium_carterae.1
MFAVRIAASVGGQRRKILLQLAAEGKARLNAWHCSARCQVLPTGLTTRLLRSSDNGKVVKQSFYPTFPPSRLSTTVQQKSPEQATEDGCNEE